MGCGRLLALSALFPLVLCNCSLFTSSPPSDLTRAAVIRVAGEYVANVVRRSEDQLEAMVLWADYAHNNGGLSKETYLEQLAAMPELPLDKNHPLINLDVHEIDIDANDAEVTFRKVGVDSGAEDIVVTLLWAGQGWLITDDTLFGDDGLVAKMIAEPLGDVS